MSPEGRSRRLTLSPHHCRANLTLEFAPNADAKSPLELVACGDVRIDSLGHGSGLGQRPIGLSMRSNMSPRPVFSAAPTEPRPRPETLPRAYAHLLPQSVVEAAEQVTELIG